MGNSASKDLFVSQAIKDIRDKATNHAQCDDVETLEEFKQELIRTRAMHLQILERLVFPMAETETKSKMTPSTQPTVTNLQNSPPYAFHCFKTCFFIGS